MDRYLESGDESCLDRITMYGYKGADRPDRDDDTPSGLLRAGWDTYPVAEFKAEQVRLARPMRRISERRAPGTARMRFFGFDIDANPNAGYPHVDAALAHASAPVALDEVRRRFERVAGESVADELARLRACIEALEAAREPVEREMGRAWTENLHADLCTMRDSFEYVQLTYPATTWEQVAEGMALREVLMRRRVMRVLDQLRSDERVVLMAHNMHLAKDDERIRAPGAVGPGGGQERAIGTWLNRERPGEVASTWMLFEHGEDLQPRADLPRRLRSDAGSLNAALAGVAPAFALRTESADPRAAPLSNEGGVSMLYNFVSTLRLTEQADLILFVQEVTPLRAGD